LFINFDIYLHNYYSFPQAYHLTATLSAIANPAACFLTFFVEVKGLLSVCALSSLGSCMGAYLLYTAAASPHPPLAETETLGVATIVCVLLRKRIDLN
jgi:riboflavin transporter 2